MSLKELFTSELTDIIKLGRNYGIMTYDDAKEYLHERAKKEIGEVPGNFYKIRKMVLHGKVDTSYMSEEEMMKSKPSGAWKDLKNTQLYKQLMN